MPRSILTEGFSFQDSDDNEQEYQKLPAWLGGSNDVLARWVGHGNVADGR